MIHVIQLLLRQHVHLIKCILCAQTSFVYTIMITIIVQ